MRVLMVPHLSQYRREESGIRRVVEAYFQHLPQFGVELVGLQEPYDLLAAHAASTARCDIHHCHGLYWTADYEASAWEWKVNKQVIENARQARAITVPSAWVAETFQRDMRMTPHVVPHGIDVDEWAAHDEPQGEFLLWNKNRMGDVCDPGPMMALARRFPRGEIVTTFAPPGAPHNVRVIGLIPHSEMRRLVQSCHVYLATTKETGGIGILEAMAAAKPVLGYAHGAAVELVEHGVNGYLARPGDLEDLAEGMVYCSTNHAQLGANGQGMARQWTWERACEMVAEIYRAALVREDPTAAIIIPAHDYADVVGRAIDSAVSQTWPQLVDVIVVDDGSDDDGATQREVEAWAERDPRVRYVRQGNAGVAVARNRGIAETSAKYVCCLDADDAVQPGFLAACIPPLEADPSLGIAYTGLWYTTPKGEQGLSDWPPQFDYDASLRHKNQVPTCCVFRRVMWERLGGYRQRYAPRGAGEEDAEFWVRAGAAGWGARKVTDEGLFLYSWQSGRVSGDRDHPTTDWLAWHPWVRDGEHPFASLATPAKFSHPVRAYDEPTVSVVIPVGPGHEREIVNALDSLEGQTFRGWEAIVVDDTGDGVQADLGTAYPYVRWVATEGSVGAGRARNLGALAARGGLLLFLDADDWLFGNEALEKMVDAWADHGAAIYTDYYGRAFIGDPEELDPALRERITRHDDATGESVLEYRAFDYDCGLAQAQPDGDRPYVWCNIATLHPRTWWREVGGFDETMRSWEDWDYWLRLARAGKCFVRLEEPLMVYRFYSGGRRDEGFRSRLELLAYLRAKYEEVPIMGDCGTCGKSASSRQARGGPFSASPARRPGGVATMGQGVRDVDMIECEYRWPKGGSHKVLGPATFPEPLAGLPMERAHGQPGYKIAYGYRKSGDRFLVHRADIELARHIFVPVEKKVETPVEEKPAPPPPEALAPPGRPELGPEPEPEEEGPPALGPSPPEEAEAAPAEWPAEPVEIDLQALPGINRPVAAELRAQGVTTVEAILALGKEGLMEVQGIGAKRAEMILGAIAQRTAELKQVEESQAE